MSDIFDHCFDAYESLENDGWPNEGCSDFNYDRNYYHTTIDFKLSKESPKAYQIIYDKHYLWLPKKICRPHREVGKIYVHTATFRKILKNNVHGFV